ncbi:MAG: hypothetical protein IKK21_06555 [Clostridia bacterium]|nr:hypothetical protein [Clostridia bacterium]
MKRVWAWILAAGLLCAGCADRNANYYEHAQRYLGGGEYELAAEVFEQLGEYRDAGEYALYARGLQALAEGKLALARTNLSLVDPFKSSGRYLLYLDALEMKAAGELEGALTGFGALGSFADSAELAAALETAIPMQQLARCQALVEAGHYQQALSLLDEMALSDEVSALKDACRQGIVRAEYDRASLMYQQRDYVGAMAAFDALGDVLDAPARVTLCRSALYRQAASVTPTMDNAVQLMADLSLLEDYLDSAALLEAIEAKFGRNLSIAAGENAFVQLGMMGDAPMLWQVTAVSGSQATLRSVAPVNLTVSATATDLPVVWGDAEAAVTLQEMEQQAMLFMEADAAQQELLLDLAKYQFTAGSGTAEDPYR